MNNGGLRINDGGLVIEGLRLMMAAYRLGILIVGLAVSWNVI